MKIMSNYRKVTNISVFTDTIRYIEKNLYSKHRYDTMLSDIGDISRYFCRKSWQQASAIQFVSKVLLNCRTSLQGMLAIVTTFSFYLRRVQLTTGAFL